jgi:hypothetical protein
VTKNERSQAARALAERRWQNTTSEERSEAARQASSFSSHPGRPPDPNRCPCGAMTVARAAKRKHKCGGGQ